MEITLKQADDCFSILNNEKNSSIFDKFIKINTILKGENENLTVGQLLAFAKEFTAYFKTSFDAEKEVKGYVLENDITAKDIALIEQEVKKNTKWLLFATALMYRDERVTEIEHYTDAHIRHKMTIFSDVEINQVIGILLSISKEFTDAFGNENLFEFK